VWQAVTAGRSPLTVFLLAATLFTLFTHRGNLARMRAGTEPRRGSK
jgi:hypothetical protein